MGKKQEGNVDFVKQQNKTKNHFILDLNFLHDVITPFKEERFSICGTAVDTFIGQMTQWYHAD